MLWVLVCSYAWHVCVLVCLCICVLTCLCAYVLMYLACLRAYVLACSRAYVLVCLRTYVLGVLTCLRTYVLACLRAYVLPYLVRLRACVLVMMNCFILLRVYILGVPFCLICFTFQYLNLKILTTKNLCALLSWTYFLFETNLKETGKSIDMSYSCSCFKAISIFNNLYSHTTLTFVGLIAFVWSLVSQVIDCSYFSIL